MITINSQAGQYSSAYNPIVYNVISNNFDTVANFNYLVNINYNKATISGYTTVTFRDIVRFKFTVNTSIGYSVGDEVYLDNSNNTNRYTGNYFIIDIPSSTEIIVDIDPSIPFGVSNAYLYKTLPYKNSPTPDGNLVLDISRTLKDFVKSDFQLKHNMYSAIDTRFDYDLSIGEEYLYKFPFEDNYFDTGNVGFNNTSYLVGDMSSIPFNVGDRIKIQQDKQVIDYTDNFFDANRVGFYTTNTVEGDKMNDFNVDDSIYITGQITNPTYNGYTKVFKKLDAAELSTLSTSVGATVYAALVIDKDFLLSSGTEAGQMIGHPVPEYNTVATITEISHDVTLGAKILTDLPYEQATEQIGGTIQYANGKPTTFWQQEDILNLTSFNSKFLRDNFIQNNNMGNYVMDLTTLQDFSTMYNNNLRLLKDSKAYLLAHSETFSTIDGVKFTFTLSNGTEQIGYLLRPSGMTIQQSYYIPIGLEDLLAANIDGNFTSVGSSITTYIDDIVSYTIEATNDTLVKAKVISNPFTVKIYEDCGGDYDEYSLIFRDDLGSYLSIPFIYKSIKTTEVARNEYYKKEGKINDSGDFVIDTFDRGNTNFYSKSKDKFLLNSGWVYEYENPLFKNLLNSNEVYIQSHKDNSIHPVTVKNKDKQFKTLMEDQLWLYTFEVNIAFDEIKY